MDTMIDESPAGGRLNFRGDIRSSMEVNVIPSRTGEALMPFQVEYDEETDLTTVEYAEIRRPKTALELAAAELSR